jgi:GAF domain-containing protein
MAKFGGARTYVAVPMLKERKLIGTIIIYRKEVRPFTDKQVELLTNFASQAVIAIENTRLLNDQRESLERQTATSEVLQVISSSPGELGPVFQTILANATRICEAGFGLLHLYEGDEFRTVALHNVPQALADFVRQRGSFRAPAGSPVDRLLQKRDVIYTDDETAESNPGVAARLGGARSLIAVPMLKENILIGAIVIYRQEVRPFTDKQIELVQNFAAQAVIAIENARLLSELRQRTDDLSESLEQQTATSEVLKIIASSPGELAPVFDVMLESAVRLCEAKFGNLFLYNGEAFRAAALHRASPAYAEARRRDVMVRDLHPDVPLARVSRTKEIVHIADVRTTQCYIERDPFFAQLVEVAGARTLLVVPMRKESELIGAIAIYRQEVNPFSDRQVELVRNFAAQAVIAIENTRLLSELRQSLEQQTATSEVLQVISSSPGELEPVFSTMLENATRICGAKFGTLYLYERGAFYATTFHNAPPAFIEDRKNRPLHPAPDSTLGRAAMTKQVAQILDSTKGEAYRQRDPFVVAGAELGGYRTIVSVPMLKEEELVGVISIYRQEVLPFTDKQIELVTNFAAQAVIAIENTRLLSCGNRCSSKRPPPMSSRSSAARLSICRQCSIRLLSQRRGCAKRIWRRSIAKRVLHISRLHLTVIRRN